MSWRARLSHLAWLVLIAANSYSLAEWNNWRWVNVAALFLCSYCAGADLKRAYALGWRKSYESLGPKPQPGAIATMPDLGNLTSFTEADGESEDFKRGYQKGIEESRGKEWQTALESIQQWPRQPGR